MIKQRADNHITRNRQMFKKFEQPPFTQKNKIQITKTTNKFRYRLPFVKLDYDADYFCLHGRGI